MRMGRKDDADKWKPGCCCLAVEYDVTIRVRVRLG